VFHERNAWARDAIHAFVVSLGLDVVAWEDAIEQTGNASPSILQIVTAGFDMADQVLVLMTPDDEARLRSVYVELDPKQDGRERDLAPQPRPNVLFEAGWAFGRFPDKTTLVQLASFEPIRWPSDLGGIHFVELDNSETKRRSLARRLLSGERRRELEAREDWKEAGDFERPSATVLLNVTVPPSTNEAGRDVYIAGTLDEIEDPAPRWQPDGKKLERGDDGRWKIALTAKRGTRLYYKFTLGDWDHVEKGQYCEERPDREVCFGSPPKTGIHPDVYVYKWRTLDCAE
jgi:hypothetical protein